MCACCLLGRESWREQWNALKAVKHCQCSHGTEEWMCGGNQILVLEMKGDSEELDSEVVSEIS